MNTRTLNISILYVEDDYDARKNISEILKRRVHNFYVAEDGTKALELFKEHKPDLILSDIQMPEMNGLQLVENIKQINSAAKIILMTAFTDTNYLLKAIELQVDGFIIKPVRKSKLLSTINKQADIIILEKKTKEQKLELIKSEKEYRLLTESLNDLVVRVSPEGKVLFGSPSINNFLGYSTKLMKGSSVFDFFSNKDDKNKAIQLLKNIYNTKQSGIFEFTFNPLNKIREPFPVEVSYSPLIINNKIETIQLVLRDISNRKQAEEALKVSEKKFKDLANLLPQTIYEADIKGNITYINKQGIHSFGYSANVLKKGFNILATIIPQDIARAKQNALNIISGKPTEGNEYTALRKDGSTFPILMYSRPVIKHHQPVGIRGVIIDITDQKLAEKAILEQNIALHDHNEELDAFSHTVAHDLKNPLSNIMGFAELLLVSYPTLSSNKMDKYISAIINSSEKTQQIINSLLLFASVRKEEIQTEEINIGLIITEATNRYTSIIEKTNTKIKLPKSWPLVLGFAPWIEEVWANYISNAIKYGGNPPIIEIGFDTEQTSDITADMVRFWIRDNGEGISANNQKKIFNKFERLNQVDTQGHGLGLSIVRRIIEKLGGEVGLESKRGEGSLFYFTLPIHTNSNINPETSTLKPKISNLKILIAEDEDTADELLTILTEDISKEILHAKTGEEAVTLCRNNPDIDLVLMDIKMPMVNGYEATKQIREFNKDIIIIAQTAYALIGDRKKAIAAGCNDYMSKPIKEETLLKIIEKLISINTCKQI